MSYKFDRLRLFRSGIKGFMKVHGISDTVSFTWKQVWILLPGLFLSGLVFGVLFFSSFKTEIIQNYENYIAGKRNAWLQDFSVVEIRSRYDGSNQRAYFYGSESQVRVPLLVSLHTWSENYQQNDPLSQIARNHDWLRQDKPETMGKEVIEPQEIC